MGYAGYSPGLRTAEKLSPLEQALRGLPLDKAEQTLELIEKLTRNVQQNPKDMKFRKVKLTNKAISEKLASVPGAVDLMYTLGWTKAEEEGAPVLILPESVRFDFQQHVVKFVDAKDWYKKEQEEQKRSQARAERTAGDTDAMALKLKMEQDRKEVEALGPAQASVAKKLGDAPNVMRAGDIGIGKSAGG